MFGCFLLGLVVWLCKVEAVVKTIAIEYWTIQTSFALGDIYYRYVSCFLMQISRKVSIFFRLFCERVLVSYVILLGGNWRTASQNWSPRACPMLNCCAPCSSQVTYTSLRWEPLFSHFTIQQDTEPHPNECKAKVDWNWPQICQVKQFLLVLSLSENKSN